MKLARDSALLIAVPAVFLAAGAWWIVNGGSGAPGDSAEFRFTLADRDDSPQRERAWPAKLCGDALCDDPSVKPLCGAGNEEVASSRPAAPDDAPKPFAVWSGKVLARDGSPIEGANVVIKGHRNRRLGDDTLLDEETFNATTAKDGTISFEMKRDFVYELVVKAPGYGLDKFMVQEQVGRDLVLDKASTLEGVVLDKRTGLPLSGATVVFDNGYEHYQTQTDPYGRYRFDEVGARAAHISVVDNRYVASGRPIDFLRPGEQASLNLSLDQGMHLGGQVVAEGSMTPVPNLMVSLMDRFTQQVVSTGMTDAYGRFSFWSLSRYRDYLVSASGQGYAANLPAQTYGGDDSITVTVTPTWGLTIRVRADGVGIPAAKVFLSRQDGLPMDTGGTNPNVIQTTLQNWSNAQGMLAFGGLSNDLAYRITVDHPGHATMSFSGLTAANAADQLLPIDLVPARILQGTVVDAFGYAVPGATIRAQRVDGFPAPPIFVMADQNGAFTFDSLAAGSVSLVTFKAGFDNAHVVIDIPDSSEASPVELVLQTLSNLVGSGGAPGG